MTTTGGQGVRLVEVQSENHRGNGNLHLDTDEGGGLLTLDTFDGKSLQMLCGFCVSCVVVVLSRSFAQCQILKCGKAMKAVNYFKNHI